MVLFPGIFIISEIHPELNSAKRLLNKRTPGEQSWQVLCPPSQCEMIEMIIYDDTYHLGPMVSLDYKNRCQACAHRLYTSSLINTSIESIRYRTERLPIVQTTLIDVWLHDRYHGLCVTPTIWYHLFSYSLCSSIDKGTATLLNVIECHRVWVYVSMSLYVLHFIAHILTAIRYWIPRVSWASMIPKSVRKYLSNQPNWTLTSIGSVTQRHVSKQTFNNNFHSK